MLHLPEPSKPTSSIPTFCPGAGILPQCGDATPGACATDPGGHQDLK
jgi:hypothetical protein